MQIFMKARQDGDGSNRRDMHPTDLQNKIYEVDISPRLFHGDRLHEVQSADTKLMNAHRVGDEREPMEI
jgi:hypothetical protein